MAKLIVPLAQIWLTSSELKKKKKESVIITNNHNVVSLLVYCQCTWYITKLMKLWNYSIFSRFVYDLNLIAIMSKSKGQAVVEDIWAKIEKETKNSSLASASMDGSNWYWIGPKFVVNHHLKSENGVQQVNSVITSSTTSSSSTSVVFVGDMASGKSTLIQTFLKPSVNTKDAPKVDMKTINIFFHDSSCFGFKAHYCIGL